MSFKFFFINQLCRRYFRKKNYIGQDPHLNVLKSIIQIQTNIVRIRSTTNYSIIYKALKNVRRLRSSFVKVLGIKVVAKQWRVDLPSSRGEHDTVNPLTS
jgi:hypothetical protein